MTAIETTYSSSVPDEDLAGFELSGSAWRLDLDFYRGFIESVTGISPGENPSGSDCYRIGNRIEAFIEEKRRAGEWTNELVESYPEIDSLRQIHWLARFFRQCHEQRLEAQYR
jgi:hypothetical protein